jgi:hypothetical protein
MGEPAHKDAPGCLFTFAVVGAELVFVGWFLDQFLLDPARCWGPGYGTMGAALNLSVISAVVGIGCVVLLACTNAFTIQIRIPPNLLLVAATGAFAIAAVASVKAGLIILPLIDVVLMLVPIGLLLANELTPHGTERQNTRRESLTWALGGLTVVIAFAIVTSLILLK